MFRVVENLGDTPYVGYSDIISYDTVFHIIKLRFAASAIKQKIIDNNYQFAVTLNGNILFKGSFGVAGADIPTDQPVILLDNEHDTLQYNEIRIYNRYPILNFINTDNRYQPDAFKRLKADGKATGKLYDPDPGTGPASGNEGVEFYYVKGIEGAKDYDLNAILSETDLSKLILDDSSFITYNNIAFYDSSQYLYCIREPLTISGSAQEWLAKTFVIAVNKAPVLVGGFSSINLSTARNYMNIIPDEPFNNPIYSHILRIYPPGNNVTANYSVNLNQKDIIARLVKDKKLRSNFVL